MLLKVLVLSFLMFLISSLPQCPTGVFNLLGNACIDSCPLRSWSDGTRCYCLGVFTPDASGDTCICPGGDVVDLNGSDCVVQCSSPHASSPNGICECDALYSGALCDTCNGVIGVDGTTCMASCPDFSLDTSGVCTCDYPFLPVGNKCECPVNQVVNLAGTGCISGCPQYSFAQNGACECYTGFTESAGGSSCECNGGMSIGVDGQSCEYGCSSAHSSVVGTQCQCDDNFVQLGSNCLCDAGKVLNRVGDYCIDNCPRGAFISSGQCQCYSPFYGSGNDCNCTASLPLVSIDGTDCISGCPDYSFGDNGQCTCSGTFVKNGNACECPSGRKLNLAGTVCIKSCAIHSSPNQAGQCQCDSPWTLEMMNKASCVCPNSLKLSLDELNCITSCPDYTTTVGNACVCDSLLGFILSSDLQSCECGMGTVFDSGSGSCLAECSTLSPPNNVPPFCYECDTPCKTCSGPNSNECLTCDSGALFDPTVKTCLPVCSSLSPPNNVPPFCYNCDGSCKTCSGPNSNECLTCYSGYQLSTGKTCNLITTTPSTPSKPPSTKGEVTKTMQTMSRASIVASSVASVGKSGAMRISLMGNMFQYLKFMNISYSEQLDDMLENLSSQFLPFEIDVGIPSGMTDESKYKTLPYQFTKYEEIHPAFLVNFWDDLLILVVVIGIVGVLVGLKFGFEKFYKEKTGWKFVFSKASLMAQSFLLTFTYNDLGNVIFFGLLDFKSAKSYSGAHVFNLVIAILLFLAEIGILAIHYILLMKYRKIKRARMNLNREKEIEEFLGKHENLKAFFEDFNDFSFLQQSFLLVAIFRDMISNLILVTLYQYPLVESTCFMVFSLLMMVYILYSGPFKEILNSIQQILCEGILLLVNTCVFITAVMDHIDSRDFDVRKKLGAIVVISNTVFNLIPMVFLGIALWEFGKEFYGWIKKKKSLKSNVSKTILRDLSLEGSSFAGIVKENKNPKFNEDLEISQDQITNLESKMMSKDNSRILETKLDDRGDDRLVIGDIEEKDSNFLHQNGIRKMKIKKRRISQHNGLNGNTSVEEIKLEETGASK